jgi:hypothetical protein
LPARQQVCPATASSCTDIGGRSKDGVSLWCGRGRRVVVLDPRSYLDRILSLGKCVLAARKRRMGRAKMATETRTTSKAGRSSRCRSSSRATRVGRRPCRRQRHGLAGDVGGLRDYDEFPFRMQRNDWWGAHPGGTRVPGLPTRRRGSCRGGGRRRLCPGFGSVGEKGNWSAG